MELTATTKDITVEWLNEVLHENGFLGNSNIVSLKHEVIGVGEGYTGDIARIYLTYDNDSQQLPSTIIAKLPTSFEPARSMCLQLRIYEREIQFYNEIASSSPIRTPQCYFGDFDSENEKYVLLLEDCAKYSQPNPESRSINYEHAQALTLAIAEFHARWWDDAKLTSFSALFQPNEWLKDDDISVFKQIWETCSAREDFKHGLSEDGFKASRILYEKFHLIKEIIPQNKLTIVHSDLQVDNVFIDDNDKKRPVIIFDWATPRVWRGAADISRLLGTSLDVDMRRGTEKDLIQLYFNRLIEHGVSDYTYQECWEDYLKGYLCFTVFPLAAFMGGDRSSARGNQRTLQNISRWYSAMADNNATSLIP
jgi:hypothetical protein